MSDVNITREDIAEVVNSPDYSFSVFMGLISKHVDVQVPDELSVPEKKEELIDFIYNAILSMGKKPKEEKPKISINLSKTPEEASDIPALKDNDSTATDEPIPLKQVSEVAQDKQFSDRKSHIIWLAKQSMHTISQIVKIMDDSWGYTVEGKTSKTRVSKTLKELEDANLIHINSDKLIIWRGEK